MSAKQVKYQKKFKLNNIIYKQCDNQLFSFESLVDSRVFFSIGDESNINRE